MPFGEQLVQLLPGLVDGDRAWPHIQRRPVALAPYPQIGVDDQHLAGQHAPNPGDDGLLGAAELLQQKLSQRRRVHAWPMRQQRQQRLDLGGKGDPIRQPHIEQRLDAEAVAHQQQTLTRIVVEGEGVHAAQTFEKAIAVLGVAEQDRFRVRAGGRGAADAAQLVIELDVVVDLAVGCQGQPVIAGDHRLVTAAQADDRKPRLRQADRTLGSGCRDRPGRDGRGSAPWS
jgi:hypothetical protein